MDAGVRATQEAKAEHYRPFLEYSDEPLRFGVAIGHF